MKRTIALLLFFALVLTMAASCGTVPDAPADTAESETRPPETEPVPETEDPAAAADLPEDLDFDGADFQMLSPDQYGGISFVEEENGEVLNDAQWGMKLHTEERLGVKITEVPTDFWKMQNTVIDLSMTGDTTYASIVMMDRYALACAYEDCFIPLQNVEHVDLSKPYWGGGINDALSVGGKNFFGVGAFNLTSYKNTACIYYNRSLGEDLGIGDGPAASVYAGTWTLDAFKSYENAATADLNGDGIMDKSDRYTYGTSAARSIPAQLWIACDLLMIRKDENDIPYFAADGDEKFLDVIEYTYDLLFHSENRLDLTKVDGGKYSSIKNFTAGYELMGMGTFANSVLSIRDMEYDYMILPVPKFDEDQKEYLSRTYDSMFAMVPITATDTAMSGAVLEYLSYTAYRDVIPAYIESSLQKKFSLDRETSDFIRIIFDGRRIDVAEVLMFKEFGDQAVYDVMIRSDFGWVSYLESKRNAIDSALEKYIGLVHSGENN
jgi:hypothetical protein